jgi:CHAT domain-containing protein/tetratricopeptide (TPR) repeat protein
MVFHFSVPHIPNLPVDHLDLHAPQLESSLHQAFTGLTLDDTLAAILAGTNYPQIAAIRRLLARDSDPARFVFLSERERAALYVSEKAFREAQEMYLLAQKRGEDRYTDENFSFILWNSGRSVADLGRLNYDIDKLCESERVYFEALSIRKKDRWPADWSMIMCDIGEVLMQQGIVKSDISCLRRSSTILMDAYAEFIRYDKDRDKYLLDHDADYGARVCANLGHVNRYLGLLLGDPEYLHSAIKHYQLARKIWKHNDQYSDAAITCDNLGVTYKALGFLTGDETFYRNSISLFRRALAEFSGNELDKSQILTNCCQAVQDYINLRPSNRTLGNMNALKRDWRLANASLQRARSNPIVRRWLFYWAEVHTRIGMLKMNEGFMRRDVSILRTSKLAFKLALDYDSAKWSRWSRWIRVPNPYKNSALGSNTRLIAYFGLGLASDRLSMLVNDPKLVDETVRAYREALKICDARDSEDDQQDVTRRLVNTLIRSGRYNDSVSLIETTILRNDNASIDLGRSSAGRRRVVDRVADFYPMLSLCLLRQPYPDSTRALIVSESGRARLLAAALALDTVRIEDISDADLRREIESKLDRRADLQVRLFYDKPSVTTVSLSMSDEERKRLRSERQEITDALVSLFEEHGLTSISKRLSFENILDAVPKSGALILPVLTESAAFTFVVTESGTPEVLDLPGLDLQMVRTQLFGEPGWINAYKAYSNKHEGKDTDTASAWQQQLTGTLAWLWERLLAPIHLHLRDGAHLAQDAPVVILPPGLLGLLPLHAAGPSHHGRYFCDYWTVSYAPSVRSLLTCQTRRDERASVPARVLAAVDPNGNLPRARAEGPMLRQNFTTHGREPIILTGEDATISRVLGALFGATVFHASTHGSHEWMEPAKSGLCLADGVLQFDMLRHARLDAMRLVFLAACESGLAGVRRLSEEFIGLPTALVEAGAAAVVGSLWPIGDTSAFLLARRFYDLMFDATGHERMAPATALRAACAWLRDVTFGELKQEFPLAHFPSGVALVLRSPRMFPGALEPDSPAHSKEPYLPLGPDDKRPFAHPTHWAAFTCTGS